MEIKTTSLTYCIPIDPFAQLIQVEISGCDESKLPALCVLTANTNITVKVDFGVPENSSVLNLATYDTTFHHFITFLQTDGCKHVQCPVKKGNKYTVQFDAIVDFTELTDRVHVVYMSIKGFDRLLACGTFTVASQFESLPDGYNITNLNNFDN